MSKQTTLLPLLGVRKQETSESCSIKVDVTGFYASEVSVTAARDALVVDLTSKHQPGQSYYLGEKDIEQTSRVIPLGFGVDSKNIMTHFNNGKLEIFVRKASNHLSQKVVAA